MGWRERQPGGEGEEERSQVQVRAVQVQPRPLSDAALLVKGGE